ncbi:MAG: ester cyclase [Dehalococcoidia bacterium]
MAEPAAIARDYLNLFNASSPVADAGIVAPGITFRMNGNELPPGPATLEMRMAAFREAAPDRRVEVDTVIGAGPDVAVRYRVAGTHTGPLRLPGTGIELPPSGRAFSYVGAAFLRIEDGQVVSEETVGDLLGALTRG